MGLFMGYFNDVIMLHISDKQIRLKYNYLMNHKHNSQHSNLILSETTILKMVCFSLI